MTIRKKRKFKAIISTFLCLALLGGAVFGISKLLKNDSDTVEIKNSAFAVGALDEEGKYVENKQTLYTKEMFRCDGLTVDLAKNCTSIYQIFYYDEDGEFIEATDVFAEDFEGEIASGAVNARVMITPEIPEDKTVEDFKINFFTKNSYLKGITITVNNYQDISESSDQFATNIIKAFNKGYNFTVSGSDLGIVEDSATSCYIFTPNTCFLLINDSDNTITYTTRGGGGGSLSSKTLEPDSYIIVYSSYYNMDHAISWNVNDPAPTVILLEN